VLWPITSLIPPFPRGSLYGYSGCCNVNNCPGLDGFTSEPHAFIDGHLGTVIADGLTVREMIGVSRRPGHRDADY
jgi:hypothetical protein